MSDQEKIALFLATKGVTRVAPEERAMSEREIWLARRGESEQSYIDQRRIVHVRGVGEVVVNGLGEAC